jgi:hypothetical protein
MSDLAESPIRQNMQPDRFFPASLRLKQFAKAWLWPIRGGPLLPVSRPVLRRSCGQGSRRSLSPTCRRTGIVHGVLIGSSPVRDRCTSGIPRSSGNVAIGSYLGPSSPWSPGMGTMVLIPRRPESCQRGPLSETPSAPPQNLLRIYRQMSPRAAEVMANRDPQAPGGSNLTALLTGSSRVR